MVFPPTQVWRRLIGFDCTLIWIASLAAPFFPQPVRGPTFLSPAPSAVTTSATCPIVGVLGRQFCLENAVALACCEMVVGLNVAVRDFDIGVPTGWIDGLLLFHGAQIGVSRLCCGRTNTSPSVRTKTKSNFGSWSPPQEARLNWLVNTGAPGWWSSPVKLVRVGSEKCRQFLLVGKAKVRSEPIMPSRTKQAWVLRWGSMHVCSSARCVYGSLQC